MKKTLMDFGLVIILLLVVIVMTGNHSIRKFKKPSGVLAQLDSALNKEIKLQVQIILQNDSLDKNYRLTSESAFKNRFSEAKINLLKQEKEVDYLRNKALSEK